MAHVTFSVPDEVGQKILGLFNSGRPARVILIFKGKRVVGVEAQDVWLDSAATSAEHATNGSATRTFLPSATGVVVAAVGTGYGPT